jgi:hypothetical protein
VDLTLSGFAYYSEDARAFDTVLRRTLDACSATPACRLDLVGSDALADYDALAARLRHGALKYDFVLRDGTVQVRSFGLGDLETAAAGYVYGEFDRMLFQRALTWASRGQLLPLARLVYISLGQDPETLDAIPDPTYSDAMYYAVECMDYAYGSGSTASRTERYLDAGERAGVRHVRIGSVFYGDLPCASWPAHPAPGRPGYLTKEPFPTFVLASSWDPATPFAGAKRIYDHLDDAYFIVQPGGPHVIFGRGNACPRSPASTRTCGRRPSSSRTWGAPSRRCAASTTRSTTPPTTGRGTASTRFGTAASSEAGSATSRMWSATASRCRLASSPRACRSPARDRSTSRRAPCGSP